MKLGFFLLGIVIIACGAPQEPASCTNDNDCLGERICVANGCTDRLGEGEGESSEGEGDIGEGEGEGEGERIGSFVYTGQPVDDGDVVNAAILGNITATNGCNFTRNEGTFELTDCLLSNGNNSQSITVVVATALLTITGREDYATDGDDGFVGPGTYDVGVESNPNDLNCGDPIDPIVIDNNTADTTVTTPVVTCDDERIIGGPITATPASVTVLFNQLPTQMNKSLKAGVLTTSMLPTGCAFDPLLTEIGGTDTNVTFTCTNTDGESSRIMTIEVTPEFGLLVGARVEGSVNQLLYQSWGVPEGDGCTKLEELVEAPWLESALLDRGSLMWMPITINNDSTTASNCGAVDTAAPASVAASVGITQGNFQEPRSANALVVFGSVAINDEPSLQAMPTIRFNGLRFVTGKFEVRGMSVDPPVPLGILASSLEAIGDGTSESGFELASNTRGISPTFTSLRYIGGALTVTGNTNLGSLTLPELREVGGALSISNNGVLATILMDSLTTVTPSSSLISIERNAANLGCDAIFNVVRDITPERQCLAQMSLENNVGATCITAQTPANICTP